MLSRRSHHGKPAAAWMVITRRYFGDHSTGGRVDNAFPKKEQDEYLAPHQSKAYKTGELTNFKWDYEGTIQEDQFYWTKMIGNALKTDQMVIDKRCFGIPFKIDDAQALDCAINHHRTSVNIESVERLMLPFWFGSVSCGGQFSTEILQQDPTSIVRHNYRWNRTAPYTFSYPFGEHNYFNQISASYLIANSTAENLLAGTHAPSMMISRFELLEELEELKVTPTMIPFVMSTETACGLLSQRLTRDRVELVAKRELRKYHGSFMKANIRMLGYHAEVVSIRPVYLPMYKLMVRTSSNTTAVPTYICGATGKTTGPVVHLTTRNKTVTSGLTITTAYTLLQISCPPQLSLVLAVGLALGSLYAARYYRFLEVAKFRAMEEAELKAKAHMNYKTDQVGFKWTVEDEEASEYMYREELREKARKRANFEQRVKEEAAQEDAQRLGRAYSKARRASKQQHNDPDPLGYYAILGLKDKEGKASTGDIGKAFRAQAHKSHPDIQKTQEQQEKATSAMQKLVEAYTVLRDAKLRGEYDSGQLGKI